MSTAGLVMRADDGGSLPLQPDRWHGFPSEDEDAVLAGLTGPVLDVGCGPGRAVERLARHGIAALGIDTAAGAVDLARRRGCHVLQRSVFDRLPGEGRWRTVLLLDGNIGIGGDAVQLLSRCRQLAGPDHHVVVEVGEPGAGWRTCRVRLERGEDTTAWFPWTVVGADAIARVAGQAGLRVVDVAPIELDRWIAWLV